MKKIKLTDIDNRHPFKVPDGYFDELQKSLERSIETEKETRVVSMNRGNLMKYLAAAIILLALISYPVSQFISNRSETDLLANISNEEILYYIDYYDIQEAELIETIDIEIDFSELPSALPEEMELDDESLEMLYLEYGINEI